ncbi:hypothetical protein ACFY2M_45370 [Streptomyces sp. NPDC001276]|uniref:hypothetical protein n=1 Tax=Streptomyces sp. NPDC001276 TaxID=3364555 RepID=UPI0036B1E7A8
MLAAASRGPVRWVDTAADDSPDYGSGRRGPVTPGPMITIASLLRDGVEIRLARIDTPPTGASPSWRAVRLGGWPVATDTRPATQITPGEPGPSAEARTASLRSHLRALRGFNLGGVTTQQDTSPLGSWTAIPWLATNTDAPFGEILAAMVLLDRGSPDTADPSLTVHPEPDGGHLVTVAWGDGLRTAITLPATSG